MKPSTRPKRKAFFYSSLLCSALGALLLAGCSDESKPPVVSAGPAPAPSDLTPDQKQAYDEAVGRTRPSSPSVGK